MNTFYKLLISYLFSLTITIGLAIIDSDPVISYYSLSIDIFFMSILIWGLGFGFGLLIYGVKLLVQKKGSANNIR
jgi:hypothetical protein